MRTRVVGWLLVAVQIVLIVVLLLLPWRTPTLPLLITGAALAVVGLLVLVAAARGLGGALTPTPVPISGAGLRTTGAYRYVRHPIYSGVLLMVLGMLVAIGSAWSWGWGALILVFFAAKARWEDTLLHAEYAEEWQDWAQRTGALVPSWRQVRSP